MKKQIGLLVILFTIVLSSFNVVYRILPCAGATYVEGIIAQDTEWTLVDSPFVLSNDVNVMPGVTLTIEPAVEVRFGGDFSLIVEGRITAIGTSDREIHFTTNDPTHNATWHSIVLNGSQSSSFINCIIEYGTNGITVENGFLEVQSSFIESNSGNGITVNNGSVLAKNNEIAGNRNSGIYIAGGTQVTVENNVIRSNGNGIVLTGNLTGAINIGQNTISSNTQSGIVLESDVWDTTYIIKNNILGNNNGFLVRTNTSTNIARNYISNNTIGIYYESGNNHEAHFNDIYDNALGMDVSSTANVTATYNYWGHRSGPLHASLNPYGKGNPVGGNGVNLDFIFFLTAPFDHDNEVPTAILWTDKMLVAPNQNVTFIGTHSHDDGRVDQYFFDFGDGASTGWITLSLFNHAYSSTGTYVASLKVIDDFNAISENVATTTITVQDLTPLSVSVTLGNDTINNNEDVPVTIYASNEFGGAEEAYVTLFSLRGGSFSPMSGLTNSTGYFDSIFTAPNVSDISYIRIMASATADRYADGSDHKYLKVLPPLTIQITAEPATVKSRETATITLNVTGGFGQPVANALLTLEVDNGSLSTNTGITDPDGSTTFDFTAPYTLSEVNVTIMATAVKSEFSDGHSQKTITVEPKMLTVQVIADPSAIVSEGTSNITAIVTSDTGPISDAVVTVSTDNVGNLTSTLETTDTNGVATFLLTAPQTTIILDPTITVKATKSGYVSGENQTIIIIRPKVLAVDMTAETSVTVSEAKVAVTVHVTYDMGPVENASVTIASENGGNFSQPTEVTDAHGIATFILTATQANTQLNATITAQASKSGYVNGQNSLNITINPGTLSVQVKPSLSSIMSSNSVSVTVYVASNTTSVAGAQVTMSAEAGNFSSTTGFTDSNGNCTFVFNAPKTTVQLPVLIVANVSKNGYVDGGNQTKIDIVPEASAETEGGFPLITVLLIIIPIVIAIVIVVLIKLKVIVISVKEEEV